ncbi:MAG: hypothetical protein ACRCX2_16700 [Paraclostridium sp.]
MIDKTFRNMNREEFGICHDEVYHSSTTSEQLDLSFDSYKMYKGNTKGCPSVELRKRLGIGCDSCGSCWNICLNYAHDKFDLGDYWKL